ncbi:response regulator [Oleiagrimonas sp. C23AA]|uniref:response regulator n=1 Tax=Oleiagrimonas sp. C23AA TaxID=2719047 RepID=UPI001422FFCB|nr:response regulator [Oleiagrimonas sp. C23AA]NII10616.1 response regulator [Oleiagrimonas sp. C23AA]
MWRVLYIEDDDNSAYMLARRLGREGFQVSVAPDGETGLLRMTYEFPHILILDLDLPGIDGWEVLRQLRDDPRWKSLPVLVVSAHVLADEAQLAVAAGAHGFVAKPLDFKALLAKVRQLLDISGDDDLDDQGGDA